METTKVTLTITKDFINQVFKVAASYILLERNIDEGIKIDDYITENIANEILTINDILQKLCTDIIIDDDINEIF